MPTYRYACAACAEVHEIFHSIKDKPRKKCPECGGRLERLIGTGGGVILKGSGFYTTDYRSEGYHREAKKDREGGESKEKPKKKAKKKAESKAKKKRD